MCNIALDNTYIYIIIIVSKFSYIIKLKEEKTMKKIISLSLAGLMLLGGCSSKDSSSGSSAEKAADNEAAMNYWEDGESTNSRTKITDTSYLQFWNAGHQEYYTADEFAQKLGEAGVKVYSVTPAEGYEFIRGEYIGDIGYMYVFDKPVSNTPVIVSFYFGADSTFGDITGESKASTKLSTGGSEYDAVTFCYTDSQCAAFMADDDCRVTFAEFYTDFSDASHVLSTAESFTIQ